MALKDYKNVYCIGIGGIGLSALARYMRAQGAAVSGSDSSLSKITKDLENEGITVHLDQSASHIPEDCNLIIYTIAIKEDNPELVEARGKELVMMTYPEALGELTKNYTTIAVCGTHGKTTTTAMVASALKAAGKNPTVIVGSLLQDGGTNFIQGDSEYLVVEACEYKRSFLQLHPTHVLVTNIDAEHLDYYKDLHDIKSAFQSFADKVPEGGYLITHDNVNLSTKGYAINADSYIHDVHTIDLQVLGSHNHANASLVISLTNALLLDENKVREGLHSFTGTWRRLEYKGSTKHGVKVYDDYGHHPTEIAATIEALREKYPKELFPLYVFFQPHLYSRTQRFLDEFAQVLSLPYKVFIMPIYAAREKEDNSISHTDLVEKIILLGGHAQAITQEEMSTIIEDIQEPTSVVLNSGAGDAYVCLDRMHLNK